MNSCHVCNKALTHAEAIDEDLSLIIQEPIWMRVSICAACAASMDAARNADVFSPN
jgi:hypothetical protein